VDCHNLFRIFNNPCFFRQVYSFKRFFWVFGSSSYYSRFYIFEWRFEFNDPSSVYVPVDLF